MKLFLKGIPVASRKNLGKDGKTTYYNVTVAQEGEVMEFSASDVVFADIKLYVPHTFELTLLRGEFAGKVYERKMLTAVQPAK